MNETFIEERYSEKCGRYLVASRDIKCGQTVLREYPLAHCLNWKDPFSKIACHHCLNLFDEYDNNNNKNNNNNNDNSSNKLETCILCKQVSYCNNCWALNKSIDIHSENECTQLQRLASSSMFDNNCKTLAKLALRLYSRITSTTINKSSDNNNTNNENNDNNNENDNSNNSESINNYSNKIIAIETTDKLITNQEKFSAARLSSLSKIVKFITTTSNNNGSNEVQQQQLEKQKKLLNIICALECNTHEIGLTLQPLRYHSIGSAIYEKASLFNHSCQPNICRINRVGQNGSIEMIALRDIPAGSELFYNYIQLTLSTKDRQSTLLENYFFECKCNGCLDNNSKNKSKKNKKQNQQQQQTNSQKEYLQKYLCSNNQCNGVLITDSIDPTKRVCNICMPINQWNLSL